MKGSSIVLATDLSEASADAARWAQATGAKLQLPVHAVHVISISMANWASGAYDALDDPGLMQKLCDEVRKWYREVTGQEPADTRVLVGHTPVQLRQYASDTGAAILAMAASNKTRWKRFLLGSTAQSLAHKPPCPVVLVRTDAPREPSVAEVATGTGDVVVGVDFSSTSSEALRFAANHARAFGTRLHLVHAGRAPSFMLGLEHFPKDLITTRYEDWAREESTSFIAAHADALQGVDYQFHLIDDDPAPGLIEFTRAHPVELLVVGRTGHSQMLGDSVGDVFLKVLQSMPTTTCIIPAVLDE